MLVKIVVISLALFIIVSVMALVCLSYLSSRGIDALPEGFWEKLHATKTKVYDNLLRDVLHSLKHQLFQALHLESSLSLLTPLNRCLCLSFSIKMPLLLPGIRI